MKDQPLPSQFTEPVKFTEFEDRPFTKAQRRYAVKKLNRHRRREDNPRRFCEALAARGMTGIKWNAEKHHYYDGAKTK